MGLYEAAKDALKVAQSADNVQLIQKLLDVQKMALEMQDKQQSLQQKVTQLENEIQDMSNIKKYVFQNDKSWLIDPEFPDRKFCPVCTHKIRTPVPLTGRHCYQCNANY